MRNKGVEQLKNRFKAMERELRMEDDHHCGQPKDTEHFISQLNYEVGQANKRWNVSPEYEITSHRPWIGRWIVFSKKVVRKFLRWYINPAFDQQRNFNANVTRSLNALTNIVNQMIPETNEKINQLQKLYGDLEERQEELQQRILEMVNQRLSALEFNVNRQMEEFQHQLEQLQHLYVSAKRMNTIDYFNFEQKFRGKRSIIKERQKFYLPYFLNRENVLDIGCGRGEFIELLLEHGIKAKGIDVNQDMVDYCKSLGFDVEYADARSYLSMVEENSLDGIFMAQVVEHLPMEILVDLIHLAYKALKPGGLFVAETINVRSVYAMSNWFYMDPTHVKPVHPETLRFMMQEVGFDKVELVFLSPVEDRKIEPLYIEGFDTSKFNRSLEQLQELIYGFQDYAVFGYK